MRKNSITGTGKLFRLFIKRDRFLLPIWTLLPMLIIVSQISFVKAMPDWNKFLGELSTNPLAAAWLGPIVPLSKEGAVLWRGMIQSAIVVIFGSAFTVVRHTRTEEEKGRRELLLGRTVGNHSNLVGALILSCGGSIVAGLLISVVLIRAGFSATGSLLSGLTVAASGLLFAGLGGLVAQILEDSGSTRKVIFSLFLVTFVPMVINNVDGGNTFWAWFVPQSWYRITMPFVNNNIWPIFVFVILSLIPIIFSLSFSDRRDLKAGFFVERLGPGEGSPRLNSPLKLGIRQLKNTILNWVIGMIFLGLSIGLITPNISNNMSEMLKSMNSWSEAIAKIGNREGFMAVSIYMLGLLLGMTVFGIMTVLKLKKEETEHYAEMVLARPVSRTKWFGSYLIIAYVGSALILFALGLASGLGWGIASGDLTLIFRTLIMSLSKLPSAWMIISITTFLYGWLPRGASILSWIIVGIFIIIEILWEGGFVNWSMMKLTPFAYAHYSIPISEISILSLIMLTAASIILTTIGIMGFKHRSIV